MLTCHFSFISEREANGKVLLINLLSAVCQGLCTVQLAVHHSNILVNHLPQKIKSGWQPQGYRGLNPLLPYDKVNVTEERTLNRL
jgi:hypothetical protein